MTIYYFDALAGAGKTRALARYAVRMAKNGQKVLFVQPSRLLIDNTVRDEIAPLLKSKPAITVTKLHGHVVESVVKKLVAHFQTAKPGGELLFITHAALLMVPYFEKASDWHVVIDEVLNVDIFEELAVPDTHTLLTTDLKLIPFGPSYGLLTKGEAGDESQ